MGEAPPRCPVTGEPAARLIQLVSARFLRALWRWSHRTDAGPSLAGIARFHLWESPCGLAFFDPMRPGDAAFYRALYTRMGTHDRLSGERAHRHEMEMAARQVPAGATVLDVGCGGASFAAYLPRARYVGLDPVFADAAPPGRTVLPETAEQHALSHAGVYDAAVALQVLEHVADPLSVARGMAACLAPGGVMVASVPAWPSDLTAIPNFAINAPPHHLTWWTEGALRALATRAGLVPEAVLPVPVSDYTSLVCWMARLAPRPPAGRFFVHSWRHHLGLAWAWAAGSVLDRALGTPRGAQARNLMLVARKPG